MARLSSPQRIVLVFLLTVVLAVPAMSAQIRPRAEDRETGFVAALVSELRAHVWSVFSGFWEKNGCIADPHGGCINELSDTTGTEVSILPVFAGTEPK